MDDDDAEDEGSDIDFYYECGEEEEEEEGRRGGAESDDDSLVFEAQAARSPPPPDRDRVLLLLEASVRWSWSMTLDGELWSKLPDELLEKVLSLLPVQSICRMRAVSKLWRSRLSDDGFLRQNAANLASYPSFLKFVERFDWEQKDSCSLVESEWSLLNLRFIPGYTFASVATARGLLCCLLDTFQADAPAVLVINPLTQAWVILPDPPNPWYLSNISMVYLEDRQAYAVLVVNHRVSDPTDEVPILGPVADLPERDDNSSDSGSETVDYIITADIFDSADNNWRTATYSSRSRVEGSHIFCHGSIYWLATQYDPGMELSVISYCFQDDAWSCFGLPPCVLVQDFRFNGDNTSCNLVEANGRIFAAAEVTTTSAHGSPCIAIWEYEDRASWQLADSIPSAIYMPLLGNPSSRGVFTFVGCSGQMWINLLGSAASLVYDFSSMSLRPLLTCPLRVDERRGDMENLGRMYRSPSMYGFQPRLDSVLEKAFASL